MTKILRPRDFELKSLKAQNDSTHLFVIPHPIFCHSEGACDRRISTMNNTKKTHPPGVFFSSLQTYFFVIYLYQGDFMAMRKDMTFSQKIEYIKDYYKWHIIIALLLVIALVFAIVHFATKEKYDVRLFYAGESYFGNEYHDAIYSLSDLCTDVTGDEEVLLLFDQFCYGGLNDPQYLTTMTATLEKMLAKEDDVCIVLADGGRAKMILAMSGEYVTEANLWAEGLSSDKYLTVSGFSGAVSLKDSSYFKEKGFPTEDLYLILLKGEGKEPLIYENAKKVALELIKEEK